MILNFGIGRRTQTADIPEENLLGVLRAAKTGAAADGDQEVRRALANPIGTSQLRNIVG